MTPIIETLFLAGAAEYKTFSIGPVGIARISLQSGYYALLRQIWFNTGLPIADSTDPWSRAFFQLTINESGRNSDQLHFNFRQGISGTLDLGDGPFPGIDSGEHYREVCRLFDKQIQVQITKGNNPVNFTVANGIVNAATNERPDPLGYGNGTILTSGQINLSAGEQYLPAGQQEPLSGPVPGPGYRDQFRFNVNAARQAGLSANYQWGSVHFCTFGYWLIKKTAWDELRAASTNY